MQASLAVLACVAAMAATPAFSEETANLNLVHLDAPKPRVVKAFSIAQRPIEMRAATRRATADTPLQRARMEEAIDMKGVYPGYPQPALVTIGLAVRF